MCPSSDEMLRELNDDQKIMLEAALKERQLKHSGCLEAMNRVSAYIFTPGVVGGMAARNALTDMLSNCQSHFLALAQELSMKEGVYHTVFHANEMLEDICSFVEHYFIDHECYINSEGQFYALLASAMGAAHDIIQNLNPPNNEQASEAIFVDVVARSMDALLATLKLNTPQKQALADFKTYALPFIAKEVITYGTYLPMGNMASGLAGAKRSFAEILNQTEYEQCGCICLDERIRIMQAALAACDVRRSELKSVLKQHYSLSVIPEKLYGGLDSLLQAAGLLGQWETFSTLVHAHRHGEIAGISGDIVLRLDEIEGFLIRLGQNYRMVVENTLKFNQPNPADAEPQARAKEEKSQIALKCNALIDKVRGLGLEEMAVVLTKEFDVTPHLGTFLNALGGDFGEAAFAAGLGKTGEEFINHPSNPKRLHDYLAREMDAKGWERHSHTLLHLQDEIRALPVEQQHEIGKVIVTIATKQAGTKIKPEHLMRLKERLERLLRITKIGSLEQCMTMLERRLLSLKLFNRAGASESKAEEGVCHQSEDKVARQLIALKRLAAQGEVAACSLEQRLFSLHHLLHQVHVVASEHEMVFRERPNL